MYCPFAISATFLFWVSIYYTTFFCAWQAFGELFSVSLKGAASGTDKYIKDHAYDDYFSLNEAMSKLVKLIYDLSDSYTVVFIVDELDRCIPEYGIKVLERLHHISVFGLIFNPLTPPRTRAKSSPPTPRL